MRTDSDVTGLEFFMVPGTLHASLYRRKMAKNSNVGLLGSTHCVSCASIEHNG